MIRDKLEKINDFTWKLPKTVREKMRVDAHIFASKNIIDSGDDKAFEQLTNVACLPGIIEPVVGMPDLHWGYGLPVGAVGAFDLQEGIISAGMTGFDINCGIRMLTTTLVTKDVQAVKRELTNELFKRVRAGVGSKSRIKLTAAQLDEVMERGAQWCVDNGYGIKEDTAHSEENGNMPGANPAKVSRDARKRGMPQLGTLGAGNHFLEVQRVEQVFDKTIADAYGLSKDQVVVMIHCGSRGFGHQIASDYLRIMNRAVKENNIWLPDPQLVCAPVQSTQGIDYYEAMVCGVNFAFANRQMITSFVREAFSRVFKKDWHELGLTLLYDVCHNIAKKEIHTINGKKKEVMVHRKGATRSFAPGHEKVPSAYRRAGQPVLIAGSMGTASYILSGTQGAMEKSFGSSCHGAGRQMSRKGAIREFKGANIQAQLEKKGILAKATNPLLLAEEAPGAYKDVDEVIASVAGAGISNTVARVTPLLVTKG
ncbi:RNA-splicing ligase RtcB [archaeon CG10_big_fil_rev_8_21_14_0_10_43_11]|nr:MAG: RNA-splicing ligase RtcB [archaeon CG10_big_fil_rev_8_21_14_0_10_43_11]